MNTPWYEVQMALSLINQNLRSTPYMFSPCGGGE